MVEYKSDYNLYMRPRICDRTVRTPCRRAVTSGARQTGRRGAAAARRWAAPIAMGRRAIFKMTFMHRPVYSLVIMYRKYHSTMYDIGVRGDDCTGCGYRLRAAVPRRAALDGPRGQPRLPQLQQGAAVRGGGRPELGE